MKEEKLKNGKVTEGNTEFHYLKGKLHNANGPAIKHGDGAEEYYLYGKRHREGDLPAIIEADGTVYYFKHSKVHRESGPAVILCGPADVQMWYKDNVNTRDDGPAVVKRKHTVVKWKLNGKEVPKEEVLDTPEKLKAYEVEVVMAHLL